LGSEVWQNNVRLRYLIQEFEKMQSRLTIILDRAEKNALRKLSLNEFRDIRQQAAVIIRDELTRRGLLQPTPAEDPAPEQEKTHVTA
jgi:hypothetical protein